MHLVEVSFLATGTGHLPLVWRTGLGALACSHVYNQRPPASQRPTFVDTLVGGC